MKEQRASKEITIQLYWKLFKTYSPIIPNVYIYDWESDLLAVNKLSGYVTEYEIKTSKPDFKADFKKIEKHKLFRIKNNLQGLPNYFYYVTIPGLVNKSDIPEYAGLIEVGHKIKIIKKAPLLHKEKKDINYNLLVKLYYKFWGLYTRIN